MLEQREIHVETYVRTLGQQGRQAARKLAGLSSAVKDGALQAMADALEANVEGIVAANRGDVDQARERGVSAALLDRLTLTAERVRAMAGELRTVAALPDPIGETDRAWRLPNGLDVNRVRVPLGVIGMIYEGRPNVTVDAAGLCLKAGNAVILRGSAEALASNRAIVGVLAEAAEAAGMPPHGIQLVDTADREAARAMMRLNGLIDVLIPRGGAQLIQTVIENATVPVIETGVGNCHTYVDAAADLDQAAAIAVNAKVQRPSVCNAMETLLVDEQVAETFIPRITALMAEQGVEIRGCGRTQQLASGVQAAGEADWHEEYLDLILAVKVVDGMDAALEHIATYGTRHSEAIVTQDYDRARRFVREVDAAAVYVNASTRFTDGHQFGMGAEIGISTQKLHARGPMGLMEITSTKYIVHGDGQIRT